MTFETFQQWSDAWTDARSDQGNVPRILELWAATIPTGWKRKGWEGAWGYRKISKTGAEDKGEKGIEKCLLGDPHTTRLLSLATPEGDYPVLSAYNNFPLANMKRGQVISDVLGVVLAGGRVRPLLMEVKVAANDPWYATVECLKQIKLARNDDVHICKHLRTLISGVEEGAWGLVVAPKAFYNGRKLVAQCESLMKALRSGRKTYARIGLAVAPLYSEGKLKQPQLEWLTGNWFSS